MSKRNPTLSALAAIGLCFTTAGAVSLTPAVAAETVETVLHKGVWTKKSFKSSGDWSIVQTADGAIYVKLSDDFKTRRAPDLKIFLSPHAADDATGGNATDGALLVAELSSNRGGQAYEIPAGADLARFQSILIHCEAFSKLWSAADLG